MDENQEDQGRETPMQQNSQSPEVGFPLPSSQPSVKKGSKLPLIILGIVILLAAGGIFFLTRGSREGTTPSATIEGESFPTETPVPTATVAPVDKSKIKIEIQNGTGIGGEAAYLQGVLRGLGYTNITVGNASSQNATTTTVTFDPSVSSDIVNEITTKLQGIYQEVNTKTSSSISSDVLIVTGLREGQTARPSATPAPSPSVSPSPTPSPT